MTDIGYQYTKPRGPVAAMYGSPGPCYALPGLVGETQHDPRSVHNKAPSYPFGVRHGKWTDECSPGPSHYPNPKMYRNGLDGTPQYSLYGRHRDPELFKVPGPGAYSPETTGNVAHKCPPAYSFGSRHKHAATDKTPGEIIFANRNVFLVRKSVIFSIYIVLFNPSLFMYYQGNIYLRFSISS